MILFIVPKPYTLNPKSLNLKSTKLQRSPSKREVAGGVLQASSASLSQAAAESCTETVIIRPKVS